MANIKIKYNGVDYEVDLEALKPIIKKTGYEKAGEGEIIYHYTEMLHPSGFELYNTANYYTDKKLAEDNNRADTLMRQLRRFAAIENAKSNKDVDWKNWNEVKYVIYYFHTDKTITWLTNHHYQALGATYFATKEIAEKAISEFKEELFWYFTEYKDHLTEDNNE